VPLKPVRISVVKGKNANRVGLQGINHKQLLRPGEDLQDPRAFKLVFFAPTNGL